MEILPGDWVWDIKSQTSALVVEAQDLWSDLLYRVWFPVTNTVDIRNATEVHTIANAPTASAVQITFSAAAARISDALTQGVVAPIGASIIQLPHQIWALSRAVSGEKRFLLADEVGLGKTIEAGLIMRELKMRGLIERTLVVAPRGIVTQWVSEMKTHFGEEFCLLEPGESHVYRRLSGEDNIWRIHPQVVCAMDSVKPVDSRRGWSKDQLEQYNRERFDDLISAGWDLVIVDEAHKLGGSTDQIARFKLGQGLSEAAPFLLLLTATPHQGKTDMFHRVVSLLDKEAFPDPASVSRERIAPYVIRTEKRKAIDAQGNPLFKPRVTRLEPVEWTERHRRQRVLYEAVTDYVRGGYNQAIKEKKNYVGFLMKLMQRLVTSSTSAIRTTLERRLVVLELPDDQLTLFPELTEEEWSELDGEEQVETFLGSRLKALKNERKEVELLLEAARITESETSDAKVETLIDLIYRIQQEEADPDLKVLIFTEFVPTQGMLRGYLEARGFTVACINGSMGMEERAQAQDHFAREARIMVSTDAGGEGLNLQFCHVVVNFDIPWNPMKLEQRIGRVDRIGQEHPVRAFNFVLADTVEHRVREVLEEKLQVILTDFGVDKTGDVLDSAQAEKMFDEVYMEAFLHPEEIEAKVEELADKIREQAQAVREGLQVLSAAGELDPGEALRLRDHPISHWLESMVVSFVEIYGGSAERKDSGWHIVWPDGETMEDIIFAPREADKYPGSHLLTLDNPRVRDLVRALPNIVPGQRITTVEVPGLPKEIEGYFSLWDIRLSGAEGICHRLMPLFIHDDGRVLLPTARHVWDLLVNGNMAVRGYLDTSKSISAFDSVRTFAEAQGRSLYDELLRVNSERLSRERERKEFSFAARRRIAERIGIPNIKSYRLKQLEQEEQQWRERMKDEASVTPELVPILVVRIESAGAGKV